MLLNNRIIWRDNMVLKDLSVGLSNFLSGSSVTAAAAFSDAIYIGSDLPFNHRWFEVATPNAAASVMSISVWDGDTWRPTVDVLDQTAVGGKTLATSGIISFTPDRYRSWAMEQSAEDISEIASLKIYNLFWAKLTVSGSLTGTTALRYIGHKFSTDEDLVAEYPIFANPVLLDAFKTNKTNWLDQHFLAAEYIIQDLRAANIVWSGSQILDWLQFKSASIHRVAAIVFSAFGKDYADELKGAMLAYRDSLKIASLKVDQNRNATLDLPEIRGTTGFLER